MPPLKVFTAAFARSCNPTISSTASMRRARSARGTL